MGDKSNRSTEAETARELASDVGGGVVPNTGHWWSDENPEYLSKQLLAFFGDGAPVEQLRSIGFERSSGNYIRSEAYMHIKGVKDCGVLNLTRYALYLHDYGSQIELRLAMEAPERLTALIIQNGDIYEDELGPKYKALKDYWAKPTPEGREKLGEAVSEEGFRGAGEHRC